MVGLLFHEIVPFVNRVGFVKNGRKRGAFASFLLFPLLLPPSNQHKRKKTKKKEKQFFLSLPPLSESFVLWITTCAFPPVRRHTKEAFAAFPAKSAECRRPPTYLSFRPTTHASFVAFARLFIVGKQGWILFAPILLNLPFVVVFVCSQPQNFSFNPPINT